jgi:hypothetical protein
LGRHAVVRPGLSLPLQRERGERPCLGRAPCAPFMTPRASGTYRIKDHRCMACLGALLPSIFGGVNPCSLQSCCVCITEFNCSNLLIRSFCFSFGSHYQFRLALTFLGSPSWPGSFDPPASISQELGLQVCYHAQLQPAHSTYSCPSFSAGGQDP